MSMSLEPSIVWAQRQRIAAGGEQPVLAPLRIPAVSTDLAGIEEAIRRDDLEEAASAGTRLLREFDAAMLVHWMHQLKRQSSADQERTAQEAMQLVLAAIARGTCDGCIELAEQEVQSWDRHLVQRDRRLWSVSRWWLALARRRSWLEPAQPSLLPFRFGHQAMQLPAAYALRAAAAVADPIPAALPTLVTCLPSDRTWKAVLRFPTQPGGAIRVRMAGPDDAPILGAMRCCGERVMLDADGCALVPWAVVAEAWNDGGVWVELEVGDQWISTTTIEMT